eukprot:scaffold86403_cov56-Phaeocystis_antarctica.AAC.2
MPSTPVRHGLEHEAGGDGGGGASRVAGSRDDLRGGIRTARSAGNHCGGHATPRTGSCDFELRNERRDDTVSHPLAVPERRGLRDDGAEDGGDAEEDEGAVHGSALPCLVVEIRKEWSPGDAGRNYSFACSAASQAGTAQARLVHSSFLGEVSGAAGAATVGTARGSRCTPRPRGVRDSHIFRVRTGMACVLCWSFSLVGAGSSVRAWLSLVSWLLILIRPGSSEPRETAPSTIHVAAADCSVDCSAERKFEWA